MCFQLQRTRPVLKHYNHIPRVNTAQCVYSGDVVISLFFDVEPVTPITSLNNTSERLACPRR